MWVGAGIKLIADHEFTQLIKGYQGERIRQAFKFFDQDRDGYISPDEFQRIIIVRIESSTAES
jgi:solute carrier family 25 aspartate/glutamate transporter 12/13